jgi:hypothetical protein
LSAIKVVPDLGLHFGIGKVGIAQNGGVVNRVDLQEVDPDDYTVRFFGLCATGVYLLDGDLSPRSGRRSTVDDNVAGFQEAVFLVDFEEFECWAAPEEGYM